MLKPEECMACRSTQILDTIIFLSWRKFIKLIKTIFLRKICHFPLTFSHVHTFIFLNTHANMR